jgi:GINS complex subunit 4
MDDTAGGISMIEVPDVDKAVFVRALRNIDTPIFVEGTDMAFQMFRGDIYVVRWNAVKELVLGGDAELI